MKKNLPNKETLPYLFAILLAYVIWAGAGPIIKLTLNYIPVFTFLFIRFVIVCTLTLPYLFIKLKQNPVHKSDLLNIIILGITSQTSLALIFFGFKYTSVLEGTIIGIAGPILSVVIGHHFYNEKVNDYVKFGLGIAVVGTLFIVLEPILFDTGIVQNTSQRILGNLLIIAYNFCFVMYIMWSKMSLGVKSLKLNKTLKFWHLKPMKRAYPATMLMILTFYVGLASFIPLAILENFGAFGPIDFAVSSLTLVPILGILYMALVSSLVAYIAFEWGLNKVEVKETAIFSYLQPVFTVPIAFLLLGEIPTNPMIIGAIIIAAGVTIAELKKA